MNKRKTSPLEKQNFVLDLLKSAPGGLSLKEIRERLESEFNTEVGRTTVYELFKKIEGLGFPVEEMDEKNEHGASLFRLPPQYKLDRYLNLTPDEVTALYVALGSLGPLRRTKYYRDLESVTHKIESLLNRKTKRHLDEVRTEFSFDDKVFSISDVDTEILDTIRACITEGQYMDALYFSANKNAESRRVLGPEKIFIHNGGIYLIATDKGVAKTFVLQRFREVKMLTDKQYEKTGIDPRKLFGNSIGIFSDGPVEEVKIQFSKKFTPFVRERSVHHTQKIKINSDGTSVLSMKVALNDELVNWVLSFGLNAKVLSPSALVASVRKTAQKIYNEI